MSRDWRPVELYVHDKMFKETYGSGLRDSTITLKTPDGQERMLTNMEMREQYPELEFIAGDVTKQFYEQHKSDNNVLAFFDEMETALRNAETDFENSRTIPNAIGLFQLEPDELATHPIAEVVQEWFYGNLDSSFYYGEQNNQALVEYISQKIDDIVQAKEDKSKKHITDLGKE